jgi:type I restriction enzyme S subunit
MSKGWRKIRLGNEIELRTGYPFQSSGYTDDDNDIKLLRGDNIVQGTLRWENAKRWPKAEISNYEEFLLNEGDVILAMDRPWIDAGLKFSKISTADLPCLQVQRTARLRGGKNLSTAYLKYIIASDSFAKYVQLINTGSNVPHISSQQIKDFPVSVPTIEEQEKIAKILSDLDSKIELNNKINAELEAMSKTIYDYWFVQFDFPNVKGKPYKSSGGKMVWNEELKREIPDGWEVKTIGEVAKIKAGGDKPAKHSIEKTEINNVPIYSNGITNDGLYGYTNNAVINEQSVTISARGTIGFCVLRNKPFVPIIRLISLTPQLNGSAKYFYETLKNFIFENSGSVQQQLTVPQVTGLKILYPNEAILKKFDEITTPMINRIDFIKEENQLLASLRDWLLPMLMNGQVRVKGEGKVYKMSDEVGMAAEKVQNYKKSKIN